MNLPGIGIKTAQQVWKERQITTIDQLEAAAKAGKLRDLPRFGQKREEKLLSPSRLGASVRPRPKRWLMAEALASRRRSAAHECGSGRAPMRLRREPPAGGARPWATSTSSSPPPGRPPGIMQRSRRCPGLRGARRGDTKSAVILKTASSATSASSPKASFGAPRASTSPDRRTTTSRCARSR